MRRTILRLSFSLTATVTFVVLGASISEGAAEKSRPLGRVHSAAVPAAPVSWPMYSGPKGKFVTQPAQVELIDDLEEMRLLWISEEQDIGSAKCCYDYRNLIAEGDRPHPGGVGSPIVAKDTVFMAYYDPRGEVKATDRLRTLPDRQGLPEDIWAVSADDVLVAIDARTGRTRWKAIQKDKGVNRISIKRGGWGISPAYFNGCVYSLGTAGLLYCYDAASGERIWEKGVGKTHAQALRAKEEGLKAQRFANIDSWLSSLVVADGILVVPDFTSKPRGLVGIDPATGEELWALPKVLSEFATPAVVAPNQHEFILANSGDGQLRLIDPRTGAVAWEVDGLGPFLGSLTPSDTHVLVNTRPAPGNDKDIPGRWGAYRFTENEAVLAWHMPDKTKYNFEWHLDAGPRRKSVIHDGYVYLGNYGEKRPDGKRQTFLFVLDEKTGEIVQEVPPLPESGEEAGFNVPLPIENKLLTFYDVAHGNRDFGASLFALEDGRVKRLSHGWRAPHYAVTGYEVAIEVPYANGRIFFRTEQGRIVCYDLARKREQAAKSNDDSDTFALQIAESFPDAPPLVFHLGHNNERFNRFWITDRQGKPVWSKHARLRNLVLSQQRVRGELAAKVRLPGNDFFYESRWTLDTKRAGDKLTGTYTGEYGVAGSAAVAGPVSGEWQAWSTPADQSHFELDLANALTGPSATWQRKVTLSFDSLEGRVPHISAVPRLDKNGETAWSGTVVSNSLSLTDDSIQGTVTIAVRTTSQVTEGVYALILDGTIRANRVFGALNVTLNGRDVPHTSSSFIGTVTRPGAMPGDSQDGVYVLHLHDVIGARREPLTLDLGFRNGQFVEAAAQAITFVNHEVDCSQLRMEPGRFVGPVAVTLVPGQGFPPDGQPVHCQFELDVEKKGTVLLGTHRGHYGEWKQVHGTITACAP